MIKDQKGTPIPATSPYDKFRDKGFDPVPIVSWLRQCPYNSQTKRWHIPLKKDHSGKSGAAFIFYWMRKNAEYFAECINLAMQESRTLFSDGDANADFWAVCDRNKSLDRSIGGEGNSWQQALNFTRESGPDDRWIYRPETDPERPYLTDELTRMPYSQLTAQQIVDLGRIIQTESKKPIPQIIYEYLLSMGLSLGQPYTDMDRKSYNFGGEIKKMVV